MTNDGGRTDDRVLRNENAECRSPGLPDKTSSEKEIMCVRLCVCIKNVCVCHFFSQNRL